MVIMVNNGNDPFCFLDGSILPKRVQVDDFGTNFNNVVQAVLSLRGENQQMNKTVRRPSVMEV